MALKPTRWIALPALLTLVLTAELASTAVAQTPQPLNWKGKLKYHAESTFRPTALLGLAAYAGVLQAFDAPTEWGQGAEGYGKRFGTMVAWSGIHSTIAFGLDTALHQDPRYYRLGSGGWRRVGHALRGTLLTRTDSGGETISTWRLGSAYGSAFLSNQWYPDRLNTVRLGMIQGTVTIGFDFAANLGAEFWPDVKRRVLHRK